MSDALQARGEAPLRAATKDWFRDTVFVLGPFPVLSQTFIYRELDAMAELGLDVQVLSTGPREPADMRLSDTLRAVQDDATYFDYRSAREVASLAAGLASAEGRRTLRWMMRFPHRTAGKRARAAAAVLVAAHFAPELADRGIRYVHSQFAGFQTEIAMSLSHMLGVPYGCTWHAYGIYRDRNILEEKIAGARTIITCTRHNVEHLQSICPESRDRIHLAYHGLNLDRIPQPTPIAGEGRPIILAVGRLIAKKGFACLVDAASILQRSGRIFELRFIGDGPERQALQSQVTRLGLKGLVHFVGDQPNAAVFAQMAAARVVAAPSVVTAQGDMDGLPNVVLEAMSMGRPVVGSRVSGIPEVVIPGETGFLVEPGDAADLSDKLGLVLDDSKLAAELGHRGRERVLRDFDIKRNVRKVIDAITGIE